VALLLCLGVVLFGLGILARGMPPSETWLWAWALAVPASSKNAVAAQKFVNWATSKAYIQLVAKEGAFAQLRMPSGEIRNVDVRCRATVGEVGNAEQSNINWGKAGRMRWKGKRPTVRGVVMNPVDHPHGGGEGKTSGGRHPVSPWGKPEGRTRKPNKPSDKLIVRRRRTGKNKR